ncbi:hypothetical protein HID58_083483 [Brassica napus]|uniref:X8 domain-containing protein n=1 Tax=Brassica napus TaxID=3708 RepID=A0ABQ7YDM6_BRANA|nr:hypothetical protein HID58_083483 [Brassica napus]
MRMFLALFLLLALTTSSSATYCLCKEGAGDDALQASIDYACGKLADCNPIHDKGACYQPNTIKSHCDWAVNSYFQNQDQAPGSCNFTGTATTSQNPPSNLVTGCVYPSSPSSPGCSPSTPGTNQTNGTVTPTNGVLLLLALTTSSSAIYCLCKDGIGDNQLQTSIDYACGTLADCNPIHDKGACYQPNTIKNHCDWAVNSYFQKAAQAPGSCNFSGTATTSQNPPSNLVTGCIYPSSASSAGSPPSTTPPTGTTPTTNGTGGFTPFPGTPPAFGPTGTGGFSPSKAASSLVISSVFTLCFSSLALLM